MDWWLLGRPIMPAAVSGVGEIVNADIAAGAAIDVSKLSGVVTGAADPTFTGNVKRSSAVPAAAGTNQGNATALTADINAVTGADGTKGVKLPAAAAGLSILVINTDLTHSLKVYPATGDTVNQAAANAAIILAPGQSAQFAGAAGAWYGGNQKTVSGQHTQVAASDTVVTGLAKVLAVVVHFDDAPTVKQLFVSGSIGDQAGTPASGSILIKTFKPTAVNDVTPIAATDFTENLKINWIAVGY